MSVSADNTLENFIIENQNRFYRLAYSYLKHPEDSMDAVQTAVCIAIEKRKHLRDQSSVRPWFYRILVNVCLDALRQKRKLIPLSEWADTGCEDPSLPDDSLAQKIDNLPPIISTVIKLRFYEELSLNEIAVVTNCNISTVKSRLYAGLKKLKLFIEGEENNEQF